MRLPPLNALRAFEAAARHGGYIDAADELHVTRGAISRHVKLLEDHLGVMLFHRGTRGVELTRAGTTLLPVLTDAFRRIADGAARVAERPEIRVICPPATSIRWLLPRLPAFRAAHPEVRLSITTDFYGDRSFDGVDYDLGFGCELPTRGRPADIRLEPLFPVVICPACAPSLLAERGPVERPADLARIPILRETSSAGDWADWQAVYRVPGLNIDKGDVFPNFDLVVKAAVMGAGMILADSVLCREELTNGSLVLPFPEMRHEMAWGWISLMGTSKRWDDPPVTAFRSWLAAEAEADRRAIFGGTAHGASAVA
jgi:LysR family glycine cleavage system transcriptional activator